MKLISWNVNGLRAARKKGFDEYLETESPDILCIQESKIGKGQLDEKALIVPGYETLATGAVKKGYSGVVTFVKDGTDISKTVVGIGDDKYDDEGRVIITHHPEFILHNIYFPSGTSGELRQNYKYDFLNDLSRYLKSLPKKQRDKSIICGDYNICHKDVDIHHPQTARARGLSGFLEPECQWMDSLVELNFSDSFRLVHPDKRDTYSWWSYRAGARGKNLGWRLDYFFVGAGLNKVVKNADIHTEVLGSDHCPVVLELCL